MGPDAAAPRCYHRLNRQHEMLAKGLMISWVKKVKHLWRFVNPATNAVPCQLPHNPKSGFVHQLLNSSTNMVEGTTGAGHAHCRPERRFGAGDKLLSSLRRGGNYHRSGRVSNVAICQWRYIKLNDIPASSLRSDGRPWTRTSLTEIKA
jgi:hypothetical protein